ncbi:MAG: hypothetical protein MUC66_06650 [Methanolinea sp.]|jgi:riboflavin biosynthesis pyrimidine reductase|nr:hypothetical protein [Methanolinea sp.]
MLDVAFLESGKVDEIFPAVSPVLSGETRTPPSALAGKKKSISRSRCWNTMRRIEDMDT